MKWNQVKKKLSGDSGYYLALAICTVAVAVSGWLFVHSLQEDEPAPELPEAVQAAVLPTLPDTNEGSRPVAQMPLPSVKPSHPEPLTVPETEEETEPASQPQKSIPAPVSVRYRPVEGDVVQEYSMDKLAFNPTTRDWRTHAGMDLAAAEGSEVCSVADGTVLSVFDDDMLGKTVTIEHEGGYVTHYANLAEEVSVVAGERVSAGQAIGTVGKTALGEVGSESHLHFAVYRNNVPQDPEAYLAG
ncbi:MAG: M23 family metallopeptidase [Oscillospiraceae bacterium]|nr:M23 family metallopeptidase [Oscillospiraceae bacterium]